MALGNILYLASFNSFAKSYSEIASSAGRILIFIQLGGANGSAYDNFVAPADSEHDV